MSRSKATSRSGKSQSRAGQSAPQSPQGPDFIRETLESIAMAFILAFLFRAFVAEAFMIPTGSMAPTLMGRHKDITCSECGYQYRAGASIEDRERQGAPPPTVVATTCPICRHRKTLDLFGNANERTFSGDRILVSKFAYELSDPKRWDVIVFKFPFNAKMNYIKRLIGLPNETIKIRHGNIFTRTQDDAKFQIARKPDSKLLAMLQLVDDTKYLAKDLIKEGWPRRWQTWVGDGGASDDLWTSNDDGHSFETPGVEGREIWLRYHHIIPSQDDWQQIRDNIPPTDLKNRHGQLITDFYAYNAFTTVDRSFVGRRDYDPSLTPEEIAPRPAFGNSIPGNPYATLGLHWVPDLAVESEIEIKSNAGDLLLRLDKGGACYVCRIDVKTGQAELSVHGAGNPLMSADRRIIELPVGDTGIRGPGQYNIRFSNIDCELRLWVDDRRIQFDGTMYEPREDCSPEYSEADPGDLAPIGVGSKSVAMKIRRLRVLRDIYYVAVMPNAPHEYHLAFSDQKVSEVLGDPTQWESSHLFEMRGELERTMGPDQFFPLGDNSPASSDGRLWPEAAVDRNLLIGKAILIYWPHYWNRPIPFLPNVKRMRLIR